MTDPEHIAPTADPIREAAAMALADVDALSAQGEDRAILLEALLRARLSTSSTPLSPAGPPAAEREGSGAKVVAEGDVLGKLSASLHIERDTLELFYSVQEGEPHLVVSTKKIAAGKAEGARQLAQLVGVARQVAGIEEWTAVSSIRPVAQDYGRLDSGNFAAAVTAMDDVAVFRGKGLQREFKITKPGQDKIADLIRSLAGSD